MNRTSERLPRGWHRFDVNCECASCERYEETSPYRKVYNAEHIAFDRESTRKANRALWRMWLGTFAFFLPATYALSVVAEAWTPFAGAVVAAGATGTILACMTSYWHFRGKR